MKNEEDIEGWSGETCQYWKRILEGRPYLTTGGRCDWARKNKLPNSMAHFRHKHKIILFRCEGCPCHLPKEK